MTATKSTRRILARTTLAGLALAIPLNAGGGLASAAATSAGSFTLTGSMNEPREGGGAGFGMMATRMLDGRVLVAGGFHLLDPMNMSNFFDSSGYLAKSEIYDPPTGMWSSIAPMREKRFAAAVATLSTGKVLVAGGYGGVDRRGAHLMQHIPQSAELYDPARRRWTVTQRMPDCKGGPSTTVLGSGNVLVAGGFGCSGFNTASAFLYNPTTERWSVAGPMNHPRYGHSATMLADGRVLVAGGRVSADPFSNDDGISATAETYDPASNTWTDVGSMSMARVFFETGRLPDGRVVAAGGHVAGAGPSPVMGDSTNTAEVFNPVTNSWSSLRSMSLPRVEGPYGSLPASSVLPDGGFLIASGVAGMNFAPFTAAQEHSAEVYNPATNTWSVIATNEVHNDSQMVALDDGKLALIGGFKETSDGYFNVATTELFMPQA